jgi:hypothetical protein
MIKKYRFHCICTSQYYGAVPAARTYWDYVMDRNAISDVPYIEKLTTNSPMM